MDQTDKTWAQEKKSTGGERLPAGEPKQLGDKPPPPQRHPPSLQEQRERERDGLRLFTQQTPVPLASVFHAAQSHSLTEGVGASWGGGTQEGEAGEVISSQETGLRLIVF